MDPEPVETAFSSDGVRCAAWRLTARSDALTGERGRPCVVMGHGFGATRDSGLLPFAHRFAEAGSDVLSCDYRGYGASEGAPRQNVAHRRHRQDYHAAIAHARGLDGVDRERIVVWGSSYSGGHVIPVAAEDGQVAAVISQGAAMDGFVALLDIGRYAGIRQLLKLTAHGRWNGAPVRSSWANSLAMPEPKPLRRCGLKSLSRRTAASGGSSTAW